MPNYPWLLSRKLDTSDVGDRMRALRYAAMYIGSVMPVSQGRFSGCQQTAGPGKVVLHQ